MQDLMVIFFNSIFVNNIVLAQFLGICSFLGVSRNLKTAMGMSQAVIFVLVAASAITFPIQYYILNPNNMGYMQTLIFILVIAALVQIIEAILKKSMKGLYKALGIYLPLITTNCAILGVAINNIKYEYDFIQSMVNSLGTGLGYMLAMYLFSGVRGYLDDCDIPDNLKGLPITLVSAALVSVSFFGFKGIAEGLFL
jgi:electron transport complex, rnfABCDGE type, A subunit